MKSIVYHLSDKTSFQVLCDVSCGYCLGRWKNEVALAELDTIYFRMARVPLWKNMHFVSLLIRKDMCNRIAMAEGLCRQFYCYLPDTCDGGLHIPFSYYRTYDKKVFKLHSDIHGFVNDKSYHLDRAESAQHNAEWHEKRAEAAIVRGGDLSAAKEHTSKAESFRKWEQDHIKSAQRSTK